MPYDREKDIASSSRETHDDGHTSGETTHDRGDSTHTTTWVDTDAGQLRASYDTDKSSGEYSGAHFHDNSPGNKGRK